MDNNNVFGEANIIDDISKKLADTKALRDQWRHIADSFVKHKWIYRYVNDKQKEQMEKHYANLTDDKVYYSVYKKSFNAICSFMGIPNDKVIIENMVFTKDKQDKDQYELALKYSKGLVRVKIPEGVRLIHVSPVQSIKQLIPSFRSKVKGKYMYPNKRVFFTIAKDIKPTKSGLEGQKTYRYTPINNINEAYIDPTYCDFSSGSVYVETEQPIPVESFEKKMFSIFKRGDKK